MIEILKRLQKILNAISKLLPGIIEVLEDLTPEFLQDDGQDIDAAKRTNSTTVK